VKELVASKPVVVFSKTYCPYCTKAKVALDAVGAKYELVELDRRNDGRAIQSALAEITGQSTVPNVFIGGTSIGGGNETAAMHKSGQLLTKVTAAGAV
ncbi:unnamed protein product, partial [Ascophyllum nodosum]